MAQSNPADFEYVSRLKYASVLRYTTQHAPDILLEDGYFKNSAGNYLAAGDDINVVCFHEDGSWTKGILEVQSTDRLNTTVKQIGEWRVGGDPAASHMTGTHKGFGKWEVTDQTGRVVAKDLSKDAAAKMATLKEKAA
jgi:hypothetical protein|tara:strand:- start:598 stop:1011 length:414 start_codon:yes stop_codon:yes gene_type:complete